MKNTKENEQLAKIKKQNVLLQKQVQELKAKLEEIEYPLVGMGGSRYCVQSDGVIKFKPLAGAK